MNNRNTKITLISIYAFLLLFCTTVLSNEMPIHLYQIEDIWLRLFGNAHISEPLSIIYIIWVTMPSIIIISCFADSLSKDINRNAQYIFIRTSKKGHILTRKLIYLLFQYIKIKVTTSFIALALIILQGYRTDSISKAMEIILLQTILTVGIEYCMIILSNILSLQINSISGYIFTVALYLICTIFFCTFYYSNKIPLWGLPFVQTISPVKAIDKYMILTNISYTKLILVEFIYILLIIVCGNYIIKRKEFYQGDYS